MNYSDDYRLIQEIRLRLGYQTEKEAEMAIGRVLNVLRNQLSDKQGERLMNFLPRNIMLIYATTWRIDNYPKADRLDEFVSLLLTHDKNQSKRLFASELDGLRATLAILCALDRKYNILTIMPYLLNEDIRNATLYEAA